MKSGEIVAALESGGPSGEGPVAADGKIFGSNLGFGFFNADPSDFKLLPGNREMRLGSYVHPVVTGGRLYYRGQHHLYCWDLRK
jgi:hypothetical protein